MYAEEMKSKKNKIHASSSFEDELLKRGVPLEEIRNIPSNEDDLESEMERELNGR